MEVETAEAEMWYCCGENSMIEAAVAFFDRRDRFNRENSRCREQYKNNIK